MLEVDVAEAVDQIPSAELHHQVDRGFREIDLLQAQKVAVLHLPDLPQ